MPCSARSFMIALTFLADALGNLIAGIVGGHVDPNKLPEMPSCGSRFIVGMQSPKR
jgi:hypothetical protein